MKFTSIKRRILIIVIVLLACVLIVTGIIGHFVKSIFLQVLLNLVLIGVFLKFLDQAFNKFVLKSIYLINKVAEEISEHNLSSEVEISTADEFAILGNNINRMIQGLR